MPHTLADWLCYLESLHPKTIDLGLARVAAVKQRLGLKPGFPVIIVGGTNGKGSVCAMLEAILDAAGYKVGCYTSPHLLRYNERVRIARQQATDAELCASFEAIEQARKGQLPPPGRGRDGEGVGSGPEADQSFHPHPDLPPARGKGCDEIPLTYFEFGTLAAMQCFIAHRVDVAILEVGLGGRLDAVNAFDADVAVVTSVDIDHTDYLGDSREQIAFEKAGIFRAGKVAVFGDADMPERIASEARRIGAELWRQGMEFGWSNPAASKPPLAPPSQGENSLAPSLTREGWGGFRQWNFFGPCGERLALPIPALRGAFQLNNASAVLAALDALHECLPVEMAAVRRGLAGVQLAGRFQFVPGRPQLILDVAHNPHAARSLAHNLAGLPPCPRTYAVFAMLKDKDMAGVVEALAPHIDCWLVAGIDAPRGADASELADVLRQAGVRGEVATFADTRQALLHACNVAGENDRIAAFGSFYTVAQAMEVLGVRA